MVFCSALLFQIFIPLVILALGLTALKFIPTSVRFPFACKHLVSRS